MDGYKKDQNTLENKCLPAGLSSIVDCLSNAVDCDPSMVLMPLLSSCAGCIGNSAVIEIAGDWREPSILWCAVVAESGSKKTPAASRVLRPIHRMQQELIQQRGHQIELLTEDDPAPPQKRIIVSDATVEAMAPIFKENPRGLQLVRDELAGFINSMDAYKSSRGADSSHWLSMFNAEPITVDRKKDRELISVSSAALSIFGGIQPGILKRSFSGEHEENGMLARFLFVCPPRRQLRFHEGFVPSEMNDKIQHMYSRLYEIELQIDDMGTPVPLVITLEDSAKSYFGHWLDQFGKETLHYSGPMAAFICKLPATVARLSLVFHLSEWAYGVEDSFGYQISKDTMVRAIMLAQWFRSQTELLYEGLYVTAQEDLENKVLRAVAVKGACTLREINRSVGGSREEASSVTRSLCDMGLIIRRQRSGLGRPTEEYCLNGQAVFET